MSETKDGSRESWAYREAEGFAPGNWYVLFGDSDSIESEGCFSEERARLIAAAPGLLAAARNALARLDREDAKLIAMGMPPLHRGVPGSVNDQLRTAIANAENR